MFIIDLTLGMLAGSLIPGWLALRHNFRLGAAALLLAVVSIIILSVPLDLSARVGVVIGLALGLCITGAVVRSGSPANDASTQVGPSKPENPVPVDPGPATLDR
jgi:hypothetical protein